MIKSTSNASKNKIKITASTVLTDSGVSGILGYDGSVTVDGSTTKDDYSRLFLVGRGTSWNNMAKVPAGEYVLSGCPVGGGEIKYYIVACVRSSSTSLEAFYDYGEGVHITINNDESKMSISIIVRAGAVLDNEKFYPMLRYASDDSTFEPCESTDSVIEDIIEQVNSTDIDTLSKLTTSKVGTLLFDGVEIGSGGGSGSGGGTATSTSYTGVVSGLAAKNVQDAIDETVSRIEGIDVPSSASDLSYDNTTSGLAADNTQKAIDELSQKKDIVEVTQSEYDKLSEEEQKSGVYYVKDAESFNIGLRAESKIDYLYLQFNLKFNNTEDMTFNRIKLYYDLEYWTLDTVRKAAQNSFITKDQYKLITDQDY